MIGVVGYVQVLVCGKGLVSGFDCVLDFCIYFCWCVGVDFFDIDSIGVFCGGFCGDYL